MAKYMYLFRRNPTAYRSMSPEQMQQTMKKWMDWKDTLKKNGHVKQLGERLDGTGKVVRGKAKAVTDGPYVEVKDFIRGYMLVEAKEWTRRWSCPRAVHPGKRRNGGDPPLRFDVGILPQEGLYARRTGIGRPFFPPGGGEDGLLFN